MRIFLSVGEPSGDVHGANLVRELRRRSPDIVCVGYGGPRMQAAGCELYTELTRYPVMWFLHAFLNVHRFYGLYVRAIRIFQEERPDAVVLIDFPGFNWWIAKAAKRAGIPVFYYGAPQIWAWARWRIKKMRRLVDHIICKLPFEEAWYRERGCKATYVGHPFFDETNSHTYDAQFLAEQSQRSGRLVAILPGSRKQEVTNNLPQFIRAARLIHQRCPDARFAVAAFNEQQAEIARQLVAREKFPIDVYVKKTPELMRAAECALACSGSVSLELMHHETPTTIFYWLPRWRFLLLRLLVKVKSITLVNMLDREDLFSEWPRKYDPKQPGAEKIPFHEYTSYSDHSEVLAGHIIEWLTNPAELARRVALLRDLKARFGHPGATSRAASYILQALGAEPASIPAPHFHAATQTAVRNKSS